MYKKYKPARGNPPQKRKCAKLIDKGVAKTFTNDLHYVCPVCGWKLHRGEKDTPEKEKVLFCIKCKFREDRQHNFNF